MTNDKFPSPNVVQVQIRHRLPGGLDCDAEDLGSICYLSLVICYLSFTTTPTLNVILSNYEITRS